jgi:hypothetical protein
MAKDGHRGAIEGAIEGAREEPETAIDSHRQPENAIPAEMDSQTTTANLGDHMRLASRQCSL